MPGQPAAPNRWSWRKKLLVWGGATAAVIAAIVLAVLSFTSPLVEIADGFFGELRAGATDSAYGRVSNDFKRATGADEFRSYVAKHRLDGVQTTSWSNRSIEGFGEGGIGELEGTATDRDGTVRPLTMTFVKEGGVWRIHALAVKPAGVISIGQTMGIPDERELVRMTHDLMLVFARSLKAKDMTEFREAVSERWRREQTTEAIEAAFKPFLDADIDLSVLSSLTPIFSSEPTIADNGWLTVSGYYPTAQERIEFTQSFLPEGLGWKPSGLSVSIQPAAQGSGAGQ